MATWRIKKVIVIAESDPPGPDSTLELNHADLQNISGMFWATPGSMDFIHRIYQQVDLPRGPRSWKDARVPLPTSLMTKSMSSSTPGDAPALHLKDPECNLFEWP